MDKEKLNDRQIKALKPPEKPVKLTDGDGMFLLVHPNGSKYWRLGYRHDGKQKILAIGKYPDVSLARARVLRQEARALLAEGIDPAEVKQAKKLARVEMLEEKQRVDSGLPATDSFKQVAEEWYLQSCVEWKPSHIDKIRRRLERDIYPWLANIQIEQIEAKDVLAMLRVIEARGAINTEHQVKATIGQILRYGVATGRCKSVVTDYLRGALAKHVVQHHAAIIDPEQLAGLLRAARAYAGGLVVKSALWITILTFLRQGEIRSAEWSEIDLEAGLWSIPGHKMKMNESHIVPLARQSIEIFTELKKFTGNKKYVFPSIRGGDIPMSENTVSMSLRSIGYAREQVTPHGFRATARTILDEVLSFPIEHIEQQLAHRVKDPLGRAYNRTKHLSQRKDMMQCWADYLDCLEAGVEYVGRKTALV